VSRNPLTDLRYPPDAKEDTTMLMLPDAYERISQLDAMSAIKAWLLGDSTRGEEHVLALAIRRDTGLELTDREIRAVLVDAINNNATAMSVFERLLMLEPGPEPDCPASQPREITTAKARGTITPG